MIDLDALVKNFFPKIKEVGLAAKADEASVVESLKKYPRDMLEDLGEEEIVVFMLAAVSFSVTRTELLSHIKSLSSLRNSKKTSR